MNVVVCVLTCAPENCFVAAEAVAAAIVGVVVLVVLVVAAAVGVVGGVICVVWYRCCVYDWIMCVVRARLECHCLSPCEEWWKEKSGRREERRGHAKGRGDNTSSV